MVGALPYWGLVVIAILAAEYERDQGDLCQELFLSVPGNRSHEALVRLRGPSGH